MSARVLIADDHTLVRRGMRAILEMHPEWEVCGEASNGPEAVGKAKELLPDVIIMDISMPGPSGLDATREIREALPQTGVLIVSMHDSRELVLAAREAGARGYLSKSETDGRLIEALSTVCRGDFYFPQLAREGGAEVRHPGALSKNAS
jgi:two-component system, NarL family, response regulator NreC